MNLNYRNVGNKQKMARVKNRHHTNNLTTDIIQRAYELFIDGKKKVKEKKNKSDEII